MVARLLGSMLVLACFTSATLGQDAGKTEKPVPQVCYVGPIEVRVLDPDGRPAAHAEVAPFGGVWFSADKDEPPVRTRKHRADERGVFRITTDVTECIAPTMFYAFDLERQLAGFQVVDLLRDLAEPHTVQLRPARWVTGTIISSEMRKRGERPKSVSATLYPGKRTYRSLRYISDKSHRFRFLLPPGGHRLDVQGTGLEWRRGIPINVPQGSEPFDVGTFDLKMSALARLVGQPAPELSIAEWVGEPPARSLEALRGRPVLLCFWQKNAAPTRRLKEILEFQRRTQDTSVELLVVSFAEANGLDGLQQYLRGFGADSVKRAGLPLDLDEWPFAVGIDRPVSPARRNEWGGDRPLGEMERVYEPMGSTTVLIDGHGRVVAVRHVNHAVFEKTLEELTFSRWKKFVDPKKFAEAGIVLRVTNAMPDEGSKYDWQSAEIVAFIKNDSDSSFVDRIYVAHDGLNEGIPLSECTVYLVPLRHENRSRLKLLGGGAGTGVSHVKP